MDRTRAHRGPAPAAPATPRADEARAARTLDEQIGAHLQASLDAGELQSARSWGRPLDLGDGYDETPAALRMPFKVLKNAGVVPHEVALMHRAAALREQLHAVPEGAAQAALRRELAELEQAIALRLEHLRATGSL